MKKTQNCKLNQTVKKNKPGKWIQSMNDLNMVMAAIGHDKSDKKLLPPTRKR